MKDARATRKPVRAKATILAASDSSSGAGLIRQLLAPEFHRVFLSTNPDLAVK